MIQAVFFDIDGTLVYYNRPEIPESAVVAVNVLRHTKFFRIFVFSAESASG